MNITLISLLAQVLQPKESLRLTISKQSDGRMLMLVQPLRKKADDVPKEAEATRAALAIPLRLVGAPTDLDTHLSERLEGYGRARGELHDSFDALLAALNEAGKDAKNKTTQARRSGVAKPKGAAPTSSNPPAPTTRTNADTTQTRPDGSTATDEECEDASPTAAQNSGVMQPMSLL